MSKYKIFDQQNFLKSILHITGIHLLKKNSLYSSKHNMSISLQNYITFDKFSILTFLKFSI